MCLVLQRSDSQPKYGGFWLATPAYLPFTPLDWFQFTVLLQPVITESRLTQRGLSVSEDCRLRAYRPVQP